ncbi:hypothetical protein HDU88_002251 [Geranomyces variabilis]|nr:hypothetical protein HDU88_002251 [Geranomyces variabilis]
MPNERFFELKRRMHAGDDCAKCKQKAMLLEAKDLELEEALDWVETLRAQLARTRAQLRAAAAAPVPAAALDGKAIAVKPGYIFNKVKRSTFSLAEFLKVSKYYDNKELARKDLENALAAGQTALVPKELSAKENHLPAIQYLQDVTSALEDDRIWTSHWASVEEDLVTDLAIEKRTNGRTAIAAEQILKRKQNESEQDHAPTTQIKRIRTTSANPPRPLTLSVDGELNNATGQSPPPLPALFPSTQRIKACEIHSGFTANATPCKPKLNDEHCVGLQNMAHLAFPAAIAHAPDGLPSHAIRRFEEYREDARQFAPLSKLPACKGILVELLSAKERWDTWDDKLWNHPGIPSDTGADDKLFWKMLRGRLWHAWKESMPDTQVGLENHKQSAWIDHVIGLVLATPTGQAYVLALLGLGQGGVEHTVGDALKLIDNAVTGLRLKMAENKDASTASMTKRMVMTVQAVQEARSCHTLAWEAECK